MKLKSIFYKQAQIIFLLYIFFIIINDGIIIPFYIYVHIKQFLDSIIYIYIAFLLFYYQSYINEEIDNKRKMLAELLKIRFCNAFYRFTNKYTNFKIELPEKEPKETTLKSFATKRNRYTDLLQKSIQRKDKNIALTGAYGSGKSTIICTFKKYHPEYKYLDISLANFQGSNDNNDKLLELSILQQIIYHEKNSNLPFSRFVRIKHLSVFKKYIYCFLAFLWFISLFKIFDFNLKLNISTNNYFYKLVYYDNIIKELAFYIFFLGVFFLVIKLICFINRSQIKKISLEKEGIAIEAESGLSILNKNIDEIIYYFQATKFNIVIFEDLDRFNNTQIFCKLRELNILLNQSKEINRHIVFLYAVKDDIFKPNDNNERTKFFDYIIPVIPYINASNSASKFIDDFTKAKLLNELDCDFIRGIGRFISDRRLSKNIFNEYNIYKTLLENIIDHNKLLAIVIYKNIDPTDFADLHINKGTLFNIFNKKNEYIDQITSDYKSKIENCKNKIEILDKENLKSERELKMLCVMSFLELIPANCSFRNNTTGDNIPKIKNLIDSFDLLQTNKIYFRENSYQEQVIKFTEIEQNINVDFNYQKRLDSIKQNAEYAKSQLQNRITELNNTISNIAKEPVANIITQIKDLSKYPSLSKENGLIRFLIINGYIDEDYFRYISYFHEGSINYSDNLFILSVKKDEPLDFNKSLTDCKGILYELNSKDFKNIAILNLDFLNHLLLDKEANKENIDSIFTLINDKISCVLPFIELYLDNGNNKEEFIRNLFAKSPQIWAHICKLPTLSDEKEIQYLKLIIESVDEQNFKIINENKNLSKSIEKKNNAIALFDSIEENRRNKFIKDLDLKFEKIDSDINNKDLLKFICANNHYAINHENIEFILEVEKDKVLKDNLSKCNYTTIINSNKETLTNYINNNINIYLETVIFNIETNTQESQEAIIKILNNEKTNPYNKTAAITKNHFKINNINEILDKSTWGKLIEQFKIKESMLNLYLYWCEYKLDDVLISYINNEENLINCLNTDDCDFSSKKFDLFVESILINEAINLKAFEKIINHNNQFLTLIINILDLMFRNSVKSKEKMEFLVNNIVELTPYDYNQLKENCPDLSFNLIKKHQSTFITKSIEENKNDYDFSEMDLNKIFNENEDNELKEYIVKMLAYKYIFDYDDDSFNSIIYILQRLNNWKITPKKKMVTIILDQLDLKAINTKSKKDITINDSPNNRLLAENLKKIKYIYDYNLNNGKIVDGRKTINIIKCKKR